VTVPEYLSGPERLRPIELVFGVVREPPAPRYGHQSVVTRLTALLDTHVRAGGLGVVCVSPVDVVLDEGAALVLQPDIVFVSAARCDVIRDRIWGPPDLVVEVLSSSTAVRDRTTKLAWYRQYGVRECWLVDPVAGRIEIVGPTVGPERRVAFTGALPMRSDVLREWTATVADILS
jgi:Uma2 family endonuclease